MKTDLFQTVKQDILIGLHLLIDGSQSKLTEDVGPIASMCR